MSRFTQNVSRHFIWQWNDGWQSSVYTRLRLHDESSWRRGMLSRGLFLVSDLPRVKLKAIETAEKGLKKRQRGN